MAANEEMEIEATAERACFDIGEVPISNTKAIKVSEDTYERLITYAKVEETLDKNINRIMSELEAYRSNSKKTKGKTLKVS